MNRKRLSFYLAILLFFSLLYSSPSYSQAITLTGTVLSSKNGDPLAGATVAIKETGQSAVTDAGGEFKLPVTKLSGTLQFSMVGYNSKEISIGGKTRFDIKMDESSKKLDEVVVIGYGSVKRTEVTSSVTTVTEKDFNQGAITTPMQMIQGKVPGLTIVNGNGTDPNSQPSLQLRGVSSISGTNSPLVIIDGIPGGNINNVSPNDIASFDILKDGSAAAIYGTRGTNGVIIITTKKGRNGRVAMDYNSYVYTDEVAKFPDVLSAGEYRAYGKALQQQNPGVVLNDYGANTNWFKAITRNAVSQVHHLSVSGGSEKSNIRAAFGYQDMNGVLIGSKRNRINGRLDYSLKALEGKLNFQGSLAATFLDYKYTDNSLYLEALSRNPTMPIYNPDGSFFEDPTTADNHGNPYAYAAQRDNGAKENLITANIKPILQIAKGLNLSALLAYQRRDYNNYYYEMRNSYLSLKNGYNGAASRGAEFDYDRTLEITGDFKRTFGKHSFNALAGYSYNDYYYESFNLANRNFLTDAYTYNNIGAGAFLRQGMVGADMASDKQLSTLIAFFGRLMYNYDEKYLISASLRREGSSKFGKNNKWGMFPSVNLGWRISKESFMKDISFINDLKLRLGYGVTGNQGLGPYGSLPIYNTGANFLWGGQFIYTYGPINNPNVNLKWEKKSEYNIGIDFSLFSNKVWGSIDVYSRKTSDLLLNAVAQVPSLTYPTVWDNIGSVQNKGIEIALNTVPVAKKKFTWSNTITFSYNNSKVLSLSNEIYQANNYTQFTLPNSLGSAVMVQEGKAIGNFYGLVFTGFTPQGKWQFADQSKDPSLDKNNRRVIGNGLPKMYAGFSNHLSYSNLDLTFLFRGAFQYDILNEQALDFANTKQFPKNFLKKVLNTPLNDNWQYSNYYIEKGDFIKLDNVTIGYTIPIGNSTYLRKLRVYASGSNLLTITKFSGTDPEVNTTGLTPGIYQERFYPRTRTWTFGVNVGL